MSKKHSPSVTIEEAVALMVNMTYIPTGFSLLDMMGAFLEEAEVEYQNAKIDCLHGNKIALLKLRAEACNAKYVLVQCLLEQLTLALSNSDDSLLVLSSDSSTEPKLVLSSVADWASDKYGFSIQERPYVTQATNTAVQNCRWEDVTIKIYADYRIGHKSENGQYKRSSFQKIGLMGTRKNEPSQLGGILIGLSLGSKFPNGRKRENKHAASLSRLRDALKKLTGISSDPFYPFNDGDGWKPRFKLIDDRRNADERAKARAVHVPLDEARDFDEEDDAAGDWLDKNG